MSTVKPQQTNKPVLQPRAKPAQQQPVGKPAQPQQPVQPSQAQQPPKSS